MKFTEEKLVQTIIELFEADGCKHLTGDHIHIEMADVLYKNHKKDLSP